MSSSPWAPLRRPVFRALWAAQLTSNVGGWMQSVGAQWFLVRETHSPALVALVQSASLVPVLLLSLVAGVLADALDRRRLLLTTTTLSAVAATVLVVLDLSGGLAPWSLLTATFTLGCLSALTSPAWQAVQPELVPREEIPAAASLGSVTVNAARAVGPAAAGVIVGFTGPWAVFALNALSFLGVLVVLLRWRREPRRAPLGRERHGEALLAGVRYVRSAPGVRRILLRAALFAVPACALWALLPTVATGELGLGSGGYGLLLGVLGAGAVLGVVVLPGLRRRFGSSTLLAGSALVYALGLAAPSLGSVALLVPVFVLTGISWIVTLTTLNAALQLTLADWVRARGVAFYLLVFMGGQGVASFGWGLLAGGIGSTPTLLVAAGLLVLTGLSVAVLPLREGTGTLDRTITALSAGQPQLVFEPDPVDGPVTIEIDYTVRPGGGTAFVTAMRAVERSRRRTGATSWTLERSGDDEHAYREQFSVRSWGEFTRAGLTRWTGYDHAGLDAALALVEGTARERHYFPAA
ncbi:MFS transporter [Kineosporia sp. J2-2]|uniref:MFS transporter n=1 Tax=Kineosporia corallincola TaxID=2835133 RepID=A0ABS5TT14_9ACTN|nr:MFS transporter [Kineosporia corallincola]MBT0773927.1 MFS transporter [Kineosporia corallincola]